MICRLVLFATSMDSVHCHVRGDCLLRRHDAPHRGSRRSLPQTRSNNIQWQLINDLELGTYSSLSLYEIWTRPSSILVSDSKTITESDIPQCLSQPPSDATITGGIRIIVFHDWKSSKTITPNTAEQPTAIRNAMTSLQLPQWILSRLFTHSFFQDPANGTIDLNTPRPRRYWQRFRGGFLLWIHDLTNQTTRALFFCREAEYWTSFRHCLQRCQEAAAQPMLCGVLAYIQ